MKKSRAQLKKLLWKHFATYIKNRDNWTCFTCGKKGDKYTMNAGHYIAKAACGNEYYFSETNVNAQCVVCNLKLEGNRPAYREAIKKKYGEETLTDLENNYHYPSRDFDYEYWIEHYKSLNKEKAHRNHLI